jgi:cyclopropane-fatty-acyl-phospholipid synthase
MKLIDLAERAIPPDWLIRVGMRRLMASRLREERKREDAQPGEAMRQFVEQLRRSPVAIHTDAANVQHYEVPTEFFLRVLGPRLKYSCCYWPRRTMTPSEAEDAMLELFCKRYSCSPSSPVCTPIRCAGPCFWAASSAWSLTPRTTLQTWQR